MMKQILCSALAVTVSLAATMSVGAADTTEITGPGDTAVITGSIEVEQANFCVVVPSNLPMYVDSNGDVTAATNAEIQNLGTGAVKLTKVDISEKKDSGWTLVKGEPSTSRGANEFSFTTSLNESDVIAAGESMQFTYDAKLSPLDYNEPGGGLNIVTLALTFDWED